jgi:esterase/lipase superfamily enzyme
MKERYIRWWTPHLSRDFEMLVFGEGRGLPLILFPTSFGRHGQNKDFGLIDTVAWYLDTGRITIYCPDSIDGESWYNKGIHPADRVRTHNAYENVIVHDVFDFARRECGCHRVTVGGASFGGFHAVNVGFRHPEWVSHIISMSAAFDIKQFLDGYYDDNCYYNNPPDYLAGCSDPWRFGHMGIILGTGEWDHCRDENFRLSGILNSKGVKHFLDDRRWSGHEWSNWRDMLPYYVSLL